MKSRTRLKVHIAVTWSDVTYHDCCYHKSFVLQTLHYFGVSFSEVSIKVYSSDVTPGSNLNQRFLFFNNDLTTLLEKKYLVKTMLLQLHNLQLKVWSLAILVKLDPASEPVYLHHLHVVDQRVSVLPGILGRTTQWVHVYNLNILEKSDE